MPNEAQEIISIYQPVFHNDAWWVDIGAGPRQFPTRKQAIQFINDCRHAEDRCLYYGCLLKGEHLPIGWGFRFCRKHANHARHILATPYKE